MDFNVITQPVGVIETVYEGTAEQTVDGDITLPDYYPDCRRILKCAVTPGISGVQASGGRVTADGSSLVRVIYVSEDDKVRGFEQSYPFAKSIEISNIPENAAVNVRARTDYANCRAVSQRRISLHAMLSVSCRVRKKRDEELITGAQGAGVQLKCRSVPAVSAVGDAERIFSMNEVVELGQGKPPVTQLIRSGANIIVDEVKTIANKLLLKGELVTSVLYCADTDEGELVPFEHSMPLSQIIEVDGVNEDALNNIKLSVMTLDVTPKADTSGELKLLDIGAKIGASVRSYQSTEIPVISDAYSTKHDMKLEFRQTEIMSLADSFTDSFMTRNSVDMSGQGIMSLLDLWCGEVSGSANYRDGDLIIAGTVTVHILFLDRDGQPDYLEKQLDFEYKRAVQSPVERLKCEPELTVTGCRGQQDGDGKIDLKLEFSVGAVVFSAQPQRIVSGLETVESADKKGKGAALTIYFSDRGEDVWSIARRYNTTVDAIMQENGLTEDVVREKCMLMIPKA